MWICGCRCSGFTEALFEKKPMNLNESASK